MAWFPLGNTVTQYVDSNGDPYSGAVLKFYEEGTSNVLSVSTSNTGTPTVTSIALNAAGYPEVSGNVVIPHVNANFKISLYPTQAAADSDTGAIWTVDNVDPQAELSLAATLTAISNLAVTDGNIIVGDGATWVAESGNTARTSLGVGTGDSPTFTGLELSGLTEGHTVVVGASALEGVDTATKGNIVVGDGTSVPTALAVGSDTHVLTADSAEASGVKWAAQAAKTAEYEARTSNTIFGVSDSSKIIDYTTGSFTQTFTAAATLGDGWFIYLRNRSTSDVTLDPNGSETIDGVTSGALKPGVTLLVTCDGTNFHALRVGPVGVMEVLTSGTSWTAPVGVRTVKATLVGGGGGGGSGGGSSTACGGGGGSGGGVLSVFPVTPGTAYTYAIGSAGAGGTYGPADGSAGGNTTFQIDGSNTLAANGGGGGASAGTPGAPGTASGAGSFVELASSGDRGDIGSSSFSAVSPGGGASILGTSYGGGGDAGVNTASGSSGTQGVIILEY